MNDFTKEELMELWENCDVERLQSGIANYSVLMNKIQSMIDNYCDNPWRDRNESWPYDIEKVEFRYDDNVTIATAARDKKGNHIGNSSYIFDEDTFDPRLITHWRRLNE